MFVKGVLRKVLGPRGSKYQETGIIFIIRRFTTCSLLQISFGLPNPGK